MSQHVLSKRPRRDREWLRDSVLACAADGYQEFLESRGYTALVITYYVGAVADFAHWLTRTGRCVGDIDEALIHHFIDRHTPVCRCVWPCSHRRTDLRLGLILLLQWLRQERMIAAPALPRAPLEAELDESYRACDYGYPILKDCQDSPQSNGCFIRPFPVWRYRPRSTSSSELD